MLRGWAALTPPETEAAIQKALDSAGFILKSKAVDYTGLSTVTRTGNLLNGWKAVPLKGAVIVGNEKDYSAYLEFGTRYIHPRLMLTRAVKDLTREKVVPRLIGRSIKNAGNIKRTK